MARRTICGTIRRACRTSMEVSEVDAMSDCRKNMQQPCRSLGSPIPRHKQGFDRGLPMVLCGFLTRQAVDVVAGVQQCDQLAPIGQGDWILEGWGPRHRSTLSLHASLHVLLQSHPTSGSSLKSH